VAVIQKADADEWGERVVQMHNRPYRE